MEIVPVHYVSTHGLIADHPSFKKPKLVRVMFTIMSDKTVKVTVEDGYSGGDILEIPTKTITLEALSLMQHPYNYQSNDLSFTLSAFELMDLSVGDEDDE